MFDRRVEDITVGILNILTGIDYYNKYYNTAGYDSCNRSLRTYVKKMLDAQNRAETFSIFSGMYRTSFVFNTFVVKFDHTDYMEDFEDELMFISEMKAAGFGRHFPMTTPVSFSDDDSRELGCCAPAVVLVQERIAKIGRENHKLARLTETFAETLGVGDAHCHNYGWKIAPNGIEYPVFVDIQRRFGTAPTKSVPWEQYVAESNKRKKKTHKHKTDTSSANPYPSRHWYWPTYSRDHQTYTY